MKYTIEAIAADGTRAQATLTANGTRFPAEPGTQYRIRHVDGKGAPDDVRVVRDGDDLRIEGLPETGEVRLEGFFTACTPEFPCSLLTDGLGGTVGEAITPTSEPVAALTGGDFLMWRNGAREAAVPTPPEAEFNWRPVAAVAGGLAVVGAGLGGGGGGSAVAADSTPPVAPLFKDGTPSNSTMPVLSGIAEANSTVTLTIDIGNSGNRISYSTPVDANGNWQINTATQLPFAGVMPPEGLPTDRPSGVRAIATDASGNAGPVGESSISIDVEPPTQLATLDRLTSDAKAPVDADGSATNTNGTPLGPGEVSRGGQTNDASPTLSGTIDAPLNDGDKVTIWRDGLPIGEATLVGLDWRFTDSSVPQGVHRYEARVSDSAGNASPASAAFTVTVDGTGPQAPVIDVVAGDDLVIFNEAQAGIAITGSAEAGSRLTLTWGQTVRATQADDAGRFRLDYGSGDLPTDGAQPLTVTATDSFGNVGAPGTRSVTLITRLPDEPAIDTGPGILQGPVSAINADESAAGVTITGLATPGNTITLSFVPALGAPLTFSGATNAAGQFAVAIAAGSLPDGQYTLRVDASDIAGNVVAGKPVQVLVDTVAPRATAQVTGAIDDQVAVTGAVPANGVTNDATPLLTGSLSSALADGEQVVVLRNGAQVGAATVSGQDWTFTDRDLVDGPYAYSAAVVDTAGNTGPLTGSVFPLTIDRTPPATPTINAVGGNDLVDASEADNVRVSGSATAGSAVTLEWAGVTRNLVADAGGSWSATFARAPTEGRSDIRATVSDPAGNSASTVRSVIVDTTPPPVPSINPVEGDDVINAAEAANRVDISGRAEGGSRIDISWAGQTRSTTADGGGNWSVRYDAVPGQGRSTITATATDSVGNRSATTSRSVDVDTVPPPVPAISAVSGDDKITAADLPGGIPVSGTAQSGSTVLVTWGNATRETTAAGGSWSVNFANVPSQGQSTISAVARDAAGNSSAAASRQVQADTTPPPGVPVISAVTGDNLVNAADANGGVVITGTATPNATVSVLWGGFERTDVAGANGAWSVTYAENRVPADGSRPVTATATNSGGTSAAASVSVTVDTTAPDRPGIANIEGNNRISEAEASDGVTISGTTEAGTTVTVDWGGVTLSDSTTGSGAWSVTYATVPVSDGTSVVSASATDAAGNASAPRTQNVVVDPLSPTQTASIVSATDNVGADRGSLSSGAITDDTRPELVISLSSLLEAGDVINVYRSGQLVGNTTAASASATFQSGLLAEGTYTFNTAVLDNNGLLGSLGAPFTLTVSTGI